MMLEPEINQQINGSDKKSLKTKRKKKLYFWRMIQKRDRRDSLHFCFFFFVFKFDFITRVRFSFDSFNFDQTDSDKRIVLQHLLNSIIII